MWGFDELGERWKTKRRTEVQRSCGSMDRDIIPEKPPLSWALSWVNPSGVNPAEFFNQRRTLRGHLVAECSTIRPKAVEGKFSGVSTKEAMGDNGMSIFFSNPVAEKKEDGSKLTLKIAQHLATPVYEALESNIDASPKKLKTEQTLRRVADFTNNQQVQGGKVEKWACVNFSKLNYEEAAKFIVDLRGTCAAIGMDFDKGTVLVHLNCVVPSVIKITLSDVYGLISKQGEQITLLIVILPDGGNFHAEVEEACKNLGVPCQCCLPEHAITLSNQYLIKTAHQINEKVLEWCFDSLKKMDEDDSSVICGYDEDLTMYQDLGRGEYGVSLDGSDLETSDDSDSEMSEYDDSLDGSDSAMGDYGDSRDVEDNETEQFDESKEDEGYLEETQYTIRETEQFDESKEDEDYYEVTQYPIRSNFLSCSTPKEKYEAQEIERQPSEKLPLPMSVIPTKRNYSFYGRWQIEDGIVIDWACVNFFKYVCASTSFFG